MVVIVDGAPNFKAVVDGDENWGAEVALTTPEANEDVCRLKPPPKADAEELVVVIAAAGVGKVNPVGFCPLTLGKKLKR